MICNFICAYKVVSVSTGCESDNLNERYF
uniref:Uncharacterized protein n=1 Tax=Rhizophora mucronata TaxID=61149 RepID=A0A2P2QG28_RHIMU